MSEQRQKQIVIYYWIAQLVLAAAISAVFFQGQAPLWLILLTVALIITADGLLFRMITVLNSEMKIEEEIHARNIRLQNRLHYFRMLQMRNTYVRRLYHDMSNHMITLKELRAQGRKDEADQYARELSEEYRFEANLSDSEIINLAVSMYRASCARRHIVPEVTFQAPVKITESYENAICSLIEQLEKSGYAGRLEIRGTQIGLDSMPAGIAAEGLQIVC
jgi:hypothetical protein